MVQDHENPFGAFNLSGRRYLVTGASSGIGQVICRLISSWGGQILAVARNEERLRNLVESLPGEGHAYELFDLSNAHDIATAMKEWVIQHGMLHGLVHAAGIQTMTPLRTFDAEEYEHMWRVNTHAGLMLAKGYSQQHAKGEPGSIVFISSIVAIAGKASLSGYASTKGALQSAARSLSIELARKNIRVNCIAPGLVKTEMLDEVREKLDKSSYEALASGYLLGLGEPIDVAYAVGYLLSSAAKWITGTTMVVDGGFTAQ